MNCVLNPTLSVSCNVVWYCSDIKIVKSLFPKIRKKKNEVHTQKKKYTLIEKRSFFKNSKLNDLLHLLHLSGQSNPRFLQAISTFSDVICWHAGASNSGHAKKYILRYMWVFSKK